MTDEQKTESGAAGLAVEPGDTIVTQGSVNWDDIAEENKQLTLAPTETAPERDQ